MTFNSNYWNFVVLVIELKFDRASRAALDQAQSYTQLPGVIARSEKQGCKAVLVAPSFSDAIVAAPEGVSLYRFGYTDCLELELIAGESVLEAHGLG